MLRIVGLFMISLAVFLFGYIKSRAIKRKNELEDGFVLLISHIGAQLSSSSLPLYEIYESFYNEALSSSGILTELKKRTHDSFYLAMREKGDEVLKNEKLCGIVTDFSRKIGASPSAREGQRLCESCVLLMKEEIALSRPKDKTKQDLYLKLSLVCAVFVFLMFI